VRVDPSTTVVSHSNNAGVTLGRQRPDGSQVVVNSRVLPNGQQQTVAFRMTRDPATGAQTHAFADGHSVTMGHGFVTRSVPGQPTVTVHNNGLREGFLPNNGPRVFHEEFVVVGGHRMIERSIFIVPVYGGPPVFLATPIVQTYGVVPFHGVVVYPYQPVFYERTYYGVFVTPFPTPYMVVPGCVICPPPYVEFEAPIMAYQEPQELVADLQIASGFENALPNTPSPDVIELQGEVKTLEQQVASVAAQNEELKAALADQPAKIVALQAQIDPPKPEKSVADRAVVKIPEDVRQQVRQQVKEEIAQRQNQLARSVADVIGASNAQQYLFQVSDVFDTVDSTSGEPCSLSAGDFVRFNLIPGDDDTAALMKVVFSKSDSCKPGTVVHVGMTDLQEMVNSFEQRLDNNMKKVHEQLASAPTPAADPQK
jgi:hypothetical protein